MATNNYYDMLNQQPQSNIPTQSTLTDGLTGIGLNWLGSQASNRAQGSVINGLSQGSDFINTAYNTNQTNAQPYMNAGQSAIPEYMSRAQQVGNGMTQQQFQQSPYYQVGTDAANRNAETLKAQMSAKGMYGSGNMANALQQNQMSTMLGAYDTANKDLLSRQQAGSSAMWNPMALGASTQQALGNQNMESARMRAEIAGNQGMAAAGGTSARNALLTQGIKTGVQALQQYAPDILNKLKQGWAYLTPDEQQIAASYNITGDISNLDIEGSTFGGYPSAFDFSQYQTPVTDYSSMYSGSGTPYVSQDNSSFMTNDQNWYSPTSYLG